MHHSEVDLFNTVPKQNYMSLFSDGKVDYQKVAKLLDMKKEDIAKATQTPLSSVRYDKNIPKELSDRIVEWANALELVANHFGGNIQKTVLWFKTPNYLLGFVSPRDMIRFGRFKKLFKFIQTALAQNK